MATPVANFLVLNDAGDTPKNISRVVNSLRKGKMNNVTEVTLTANSATTTFTHSLIGAYSAILFTPLSANAKSEGAPWVSARGDGSCTLNHANAATTDRTYSAVIIG